MYISSINNNIIRDAVKLKSKKYRDSSNTFLIEGEHLVNEAYKKGVLLVIFVLKDYEFNSHNIKTYEVSVDVLKRLSDNVSVPKVIAIAKKVNCQDIGKRVLILDRLQDPGNMGTIIRSAVAFNFDTIILSDDSVDLYNSKVIRSSQGMIFNINIIRSNLVSKLKYLKEDSYKIIGTDVVDGVDVSCVKLEEKIALVIGNEGSGISTEIRNLCDKFVYINMNSLCESLNAGVAASILMYELGGKINEISKSR